jgi:hypothetical protein
MAVVSGDAMRPSAARCHYNGCHAPLVAVIAEPERLFAISIGRLPADAANGVASSSSDGRDLVKVPQMQANTPVTCNSPQGADTSRPQLEHRSLTRT